MLLKCSFPPKHLKQIKFRRFAELHWKSFKLVKNALSPRDKTIIETYGETAVVEVSSFCENFAKAHKWF